MSTNMADAHIHLFEQRFDRTAAPDRPSEVDEYEVLRAQSGVESALVVGYEGESRFVGNNEYLRRLCREKSWVRPLAYVDAETSATEVVRYLQAGFVGISAYAIHPSPAQRLANLLASVAPVLSARRAITSLNVSPAQYGVLEAMLAASPDVVILVSHLGLPAAGASSCKAAAAAVQRLNAFATYPGVHVKLSGLYALGRLDADAVVDPLFDAFGADRILWGSDFPASVGAEPFSRAFELQALVQLGESDRRKVLGGNLARLLCQLDGESSRLKLPRIRRAESGGTVSDSSSGMAGASRLLTGWLPQ